MRRDLIYQVNKRYYDSPGVPESYAKRTGLFKGEEIIISRLYSEIKDKPILDIGVGPGRTTPYLCSLSGQYVGIDYSENMLKPCRASYADIPLLLCDARDLCFKSGSFDAVFWFFNGIDDVDQEHRGRILREACRVLNQNGYFVFSSHNLDTKIKPAYVFSGLVFPGNRIEFIKANSVRIKRYIFGIFNHLKNKKHERRGDQYSIINDQANSYRLLTYYTKKENQVRDLEASGFCNIEMFGRDGSFIEKNQPCADDLIYYVARKR